MSLILIHTYFECLMSAKVSYILDKSYVRNDTFSYSTVTYAWILRLIRSIFVIPPLHFVGRKKYFSSSTPRFQKVGCFLKFPWCRPFVFLVGEACRRRWVLSIDGMMLAAPPKHSQKLLFQSHFFHHKSHVGWPLIESGAPRSWAGD